MANRRPKRTFSDEIKTQMVKLYESGKPKSEIIAEYDLTASSLSNWIKRSQTTGSFKERDNRTETENELLKLRKETNNSGWKMVS